MTRCLGAVRVAVASARIDIGGDERGRLLRSRGLQGLDSHSTKGGSHGSFPHSFRVVLDAQVALHRGAQPNRVPFAKLHRSDELSCLQPCTWLFLGNERLLCGPANTLTKLFMTFASFSDRLSFNDQ